MGIKRSRFAVASFKALDDKGGAPGEFEALVSAYGNVDVQGDVVVAGAFDGSLKRWQDSGDPIPVIWSHDWANPYAHIGGVDPKDAVSTEDGLLVKGRLDVESNPFAAQVYDLLKRRRVKEFSFAYDVLDESPSKQFKGATDLNELDLIEVGPTLKGANPDTELLGVKAAVQAWDDQGLLVKTDAGTSELADRLEALGLGDEAASARKRAGKAAQPTHEAEVEGAKNVYAPIAGSMEEQRAGLAAALNAWAEETYPDDEDGRKTAFVSLVATFEDRAVLEVFDPATEEVKYLEFGYEKGEGGVTLSDPVEMQLEMTLVPAGDGSATASAMGAKAGRVLSAKNQRKIEAAASAVQNAADQLKDVLSAVNAEQDSPTDGGGSGDGKAEELDTAKAEDQSHRARTAELRRRMLDL